MKRLVAVLELLWAVAHLVLAYFFVTSAFVAKTAIKEGILAQAVLLLGGLAMAFLAAILAWRCFEVLRGSPQASVSA
jgi:hypothetical protein